MARFLASHERFKLYKSIQDVSFITIRFITIRYVDWLTSISRLPEIIMICNIHCDTRFQNKVPRYIKKKT